MIEDTSMVRARLDLSYDGTEFAGWALQPGLRTVQGVLEEALARVARPVGRAPGQLRLTCAGRTDAGVHARGQVAHVDIEQAAWERLPGRVDRSSEAALVSRLSGVLPDDIVVREASVAPPGFDARFSATERRYAYRITDGAPDPLIRRHVLTTSRPLDLDALNRASATLTGLRDFSPFCKAREGATTIRDLKQMSWERVGEGPDAGLIVATVRADAFCHSMVRSLVGAVLPVGEGRRDLAWLAGVAAGKERSQSVKVARAHGLTLEEVTYPDAAQVAERANLTRARREIP